jgi:RHS repeat-associated protein
VVQAGSQARSFVYNSLSQVASATNPESGTVNYTYDNDGNVHTRVAPMANQTGIATVTTTYTNDALDRVTQKSYSDGTPTASFLYDVGYTGFTPVNDVGRLVLASTSNAQTNFQYDPEGRISARGVCLPSNCATGGGAGFFYVYDLAGNLVQYNDGVYTWPQFFVPTYDGAGRVTQLTSTASDAQHPSTYFTTDATNGHWPNGAFKKATLGNGITETNVYDKRLQPCRINANSSGTLLTTCTAAVPTGNVLDLNTGFNLGASDNGNVATWTTTGSQTFNRTYLYDGVNRLKTMTESASVQPCKGLSWTYDAFGNRSDQAVTAGAQCPTFHQAMDPANNNRFLGAPYQYDAAGNMTHDATHSYTYDAENRLVSMDGGAATFIYDAFGARAQHKVGTSVYEYIYDQDGHIGWEKLNGNLNRSYLWLKGRLLADFYESTTYFVHPDHLGSTRILTRLDKTLRECDDYYPYGEFNSACSVTTGTTLKFTGKERDGESGNDYFAARYYSSIMGRFLSGDPGPLLWSDPQTLNRYAYSRNGPARYVDPTGKYFVVAADMQRQVQHYISTMLRSPDGAMTVAKIAFSNKPVSFHLGTLPRTKHGGTISVVNGQSVPSIGAAIGQLGGVDVTLDNANIAFTAEKKKASEFFIGLKSFAHEDEHVIAMLGADTLQGAAAAGAAGDAPLGGGDNTEGGSAEENALLMMGQLGDIGDEYRSNKTADRIAKAFLKLGQAIQGAPPPETQNEEVNSELTPPGDQADRHD